MTFDKGKHLMSISRGKKNCLNIYISWIGNCGKIMSMKLVTNELCQLS